MHKPEQREDFLRSYGAEDRKQRERLERASPSGARLNFVAVLNAISAVHGAKEVPPVTGIQTIRHMQKIAGRSASAHNASHARYQQDGEPLDRLHPDR